MSSNEGVVDSLHLAKFHVDYRLARAFNRRSKLSASSANARIFSFEDPAYMPRPGSRRFVAADLDEFSAWYLPYTGSRHFYEILIENSPCRLYFDLEYKFALNADLSDPIPLVHSFVEEVIELFSEFFSIDLHPHRNFLILDSSTTEKFSAHIIVHLPDGRLFSNNVVLKPLVKLLSQRLIEKTKCLVRSKAISEVPICDPLVYTKNRNYRLIFSSKIGKNSVFKLAHYCKFYQDAPTYEQLFLDSIIIPKDFGQYAIIEIDIPSDEDGNKRTKIKPTAGVIKKQKDLKPKRNGKKPTRGSSMT